MPESAPYAPPSVASAVFGERLSAACRYAELLAEEGTVRGFIGPRESDRLWDRHLLNCAVIADVIAPGSSIVDVGSGAGMPGVPLALARPDLQMTLLEPMERRARWLRAVVGELNLDTTVVRGRAEERGVRSALAGVDVVVARAVAPLDQLTKWCLPLLSIGGRLVAMKGAGVATEIDRTRGEVVRCGGGAPRVVECGAGIVAPPTAVVIVQRLAGVGGGDGRWRKKGR